MLSTITNRVIWLFLVSKYLYGLERQIRVTREEFNFTKFEVKNQTIETNRNFGQDQQRKTSFSTFFDISRKEATQHEMIDRKYGAKSCEKIDRTHILANDTKCALKTNETLQQSKSEEIILRRKQNFNLCFLSKLILSFFTSSRTWNSTSVTSITY